MTFRYDVLVDKEDGRAVFRTNEYGDQYIRKSHSEKKGEEARENCGVMKRKRDVTIW